MSTYNISNHTESSITDVSIPIARMVHDVNTNIYVGQNVTKCTFGQFFEYKKNKVTFLISVLILFAITTAGVVPCGGPKKSPRTSSIVQVIFSFWSFEISEDT